MPRSGHRGWTVGDAFSGEAFSVGRFGAQGDQRLLKAFYLAEPDSFLRFLDALDQVGFEVVHEGDPAGLGPQHRAADAGLTELILNWISKASSLCVHGE